MCINETTVLFQERDALFGCRLKSQSLGWSSWKCIPNLIEQRRIRKSNFYYVDFINFGRNLKFKIWSCWFSNLRLTSHDETSNNWFLCNVPVPPWLLLACSHLYYLRKDVILQHYVFCITRHNRKYRYDKPGVTRQECCSNRKHLSLIHIWRCRRRG